MPVIALRKVEIVQRQEKTEVSSLCALVLVPLTRRIVSTSRGRSPGFWLQTLLTEPSSFSKGLWLGLTNCEEMSHLPVTVARLRRPCTELPYYAQICDPSHLVIRNSFLYYS